MLSFMKSRDTPERPDTFLSDDGGVSDETALPSSTEASTILRTLTPGVMIGPYRIERELGRGGMGVVHLAQDTRLNRTIAVKTLPMNVAGDPDRLARFRREARIAARINHPNIATIHELYEWEDHCLIAMELVEGASLRQLMDQPKRLPPDDILDMAIQISEGLVAAHEQGVIHRDLKPGNIMVTPEGRVKLLDFGLARIDPMIARDLSTERTLTKQGELMGTIDYMSPEQVRGGSIDALSDLFSFGAMLCEMLTGSPPFHRDTAADTLSAILHEKMISLGGSGIDVPRRFSDLIRKLLKKHPADRPASARIVLIELKAILQEKTTRTTEVTDDAKKPMSIAVLPLENISGNPGQEYIADGMTDALITDLARIGGLRVISRTSVMAYKGRYASIGDLARELDVDFLVEGTVLHAGDRVRITAQLIRAATDEHLWTERYDRDLRDVLALQSEVAQKIAEAVNVALSPSERVVLATARQVDPDAYLLDLKGQQHLQGRNETSFLKAMRCFEQAIAIDPTYAPAHAGLADCYNMLINYGLMPISEGIAAARAAIKSALKLDPGLAGAQRAQAHCQWQAEFNWIAAEGTYQRAIERDPNSAITTHWYGGFLGVCGRFQVSLQWLRRAQELDPLSLNLRCLYGWTLYFAQQFEEAIPHYRRALKIDPDHFMANWFLGEALVEIGEHEEAIFLLRRASELSGGPSRSLGYLGYALGQAGLRDDALQLLSQLDQRARTDYVPPYFYALIHCGLGQVDEAIGWLQKAADLPDSMIRDLLVDPPLECVRADPRYQDLLKQINLAGINERPVDPPA